MLRLGGTFVLDGGDVVYAHSEELPGIRRGKGRSHRRETRGGETALQD